MLELMIESLYGRVPHPPVDPVTAAHTRHLLFEASA